MDTELFVFLSAFAEMEITNPQTLIRTSIWHVWNNEIFKIRYMKRPVYGDSI